MSFETLHRVAVVRTNASEEHIASIFSVTTILNVVALIMKAICSSETSALTTAGRPYIPEDGILLIVSDMRRRN
jgi:hypothetical protein